MLGIAIFPSLVLLQVSNTTQEAELRFKDIKIAVRLNENCIDEIVKEKPNKSYKNEESFPTEGIKHDASKVKEKKLNHENFPNFTSINTTCRKNIELSSATEFVKQTQK